VSLFRRMEALWNVKNEGPDKLGGRGSKDDVRKIT